MKEKASASPIGEGAKDRCAEQTRTTRGRLMSRISSFELHWPDTGLKVCWLTFWTLVGAL